MNESIETKEVVHATKRCPDCFTYMPLGEKRCPSCKIRVGAVESHGMAKRVIAWKKYGFALVACAILYGYINWAFL